MIYFYDPPANECVIIESPSVHVVSYPFSSIMIIALKNYNNSNDRFWPSHGPDFTFSVFDT